MEGLTLLREARAAGLSLARDGDELVIRGPLRAELVARMLLARKPEVIRALSDATGWPARHGEALDYWSALHPGDEAARLAWGELQCRWHRLHGVRFPGWQCAGCGEAIGSLATLGLADGNRVHFDDVHGLDCVIAHGELWRGRAARALVRMGLQSPAGADAT